MPKWNLRRMTAAAMIAAAYAALTLLLPIPQYGPIQFRLAEAMTVLPFLFPEAGLGLAVGCFLANLLGSPYVLDWAVGTAATVLAALWTARVKRPWAAALPPVACNAVIVGAEIAWLEAPAGAFLRLWAVNVLTVGLGEAAVTFALGVPLLHAFQRVPALRERGRGRETS